MIAVIQLGSKLKKKLKNKLSKKKGADTGTV